ncbi:hypothetical protein QAD02_009857 [Eretmocerus hayati]|uniref:Uncharacterized protein n=1 Tax=Eretmocerus hayati TaxID=131215 RepID=A0ACC2NCW2_9HYME|nr:hypothetical protein QAD02_009857 [Eretmocerus hayati]
MVHCIVPKCKTNRVTGNNKLVFKVPSDPVARNLWQRRIGVAQLNSKSLVCYRHFQKEDILKQSVYRDQYGNIIYSVPLRRRRLKKGALPLQRLQDSDQDFNVRSTADSCEDDRSGTESEPKAIISPEPSISDSGLTSFLENLIQELGTSI